MEKNKYLNFSRLSKQVRCELLINLKTYLFILLGLGIGIYLFSYFAMYNSRHMSPGNYMPLFIFYLAAVAAIVGTAFSSFNTSPKAAGYLLMPGSTFEKYLVQFIIRFVILLPIALGLFWVGTHLAKASLIPSPRRFYDPAKIQDFKFSFLFSEMDTRLDKALFVASLFSGLTLFFAGAAFFNRYALIKTIISIGVMVAATLLLMVLFSHIFFPSRVVGFGIHFESFKTYGNLYGFQLLVYVIGGLSWLFFLPLAYFKLKENEL